MQVPDGYPCGEGTSVEGWPAGIEDRYRPARFLHLSATNALVLAVERATGRRVVVKALRRIGDPELRARFRREVGALRGLEHPAIVEVLAAGEADGIPYLVTPYVPGRPLSKRPRLADPVATMLQIADALEAIHALGLVHRDLKPSNILVDENGDARLIDFGLVQGPGHRRLTATGWVMGTAGYTAPEVFRTRRASRRADWFAWGVTFFWLLEGRLPYTPAQIMAAAVGERLEPPTLRRAEGPVAGAILRALAPDPIDRPCSKWTVERLLRRAPPTDSTSRALPLPRGIRPPVRGRLWDLWRAFMAV
jgi:serine/threonine protein kinase